MSLIDLIIGVLAPYECLGCAAEGSLLCESCTKQLPSPPASGELPGIYSVKAGTVYAGAAKDLVWMLKSSGARAAVRPMAARLAPLVGSTDAVIVPVPTATGRVRSRGYDQAKLLARELARRTDLPYLDCLARSGQTHQVGAGRQQRLGQLETAFRLRQSTRVRRAHILLIDDVMTTGATMEAAAKVLNAAGANRVEALAFCHA